MRSTDIVIIYTMKGLFHSATARTIEQAKEMAANIRACGYNVEGIYELKEVRTEVTV